ncbi:hypothetical protein DICA4_F09802 [Diutina catenulata]
MPPKQAVQRLAQLVRDKKYRQVWQHAAKLRATPGFVPDPDTYHTLLQACHHDRSGRMCDTAVNLYYEALHQPQLERQPVPPLSVADRDRLTSALVDAMRHTRDPVDPEVVAQMVDSGHARVVSLHQMLNTGQNERAVELFNEHPIDDIPAIARFLSMLVDTTNLDELAVQLARVVATHPEAVAPELWQRATVAAIDACHYQLIRICYHEHVMRGAPVDPSPERALFTPDPTTEVTDDMLVAILHCLAMHGDVAATSALVETHFIHKKLRGRKGLSTELMVQIIDSYCYHDNPGDFSQVWEVAALFLEVAPITYRDVSVAVSHKIARYQGIVDHNVEATRRNRARADHFKRNDPENPVVPFKRASSKNMTSAQGNVMSNFSVLEPFVVEQIRFTQANPKLTTLAINCILNHVNLYQNFSGVVRVLVALKRVSSSFLQWLDDDSYDIIYTCLSNSANKQAGVALLRWLSPRSEYHYRCLVSTSLRGYIHPGVQYYLHEYLRHHEPHPKLVSLLATVPHEVVSEEPRTDNLWHQISTGKAPEQGWEAFWDENGLNKDPANVDQRGKTTFNRKYYRQYDERDARFLEYAFK